jgi:hypothetical protein
MNAKSTLAQWLANGDLDRTLRGLEWLQSQHRTALDTDLVLQQSRFQWLQQQHNQGVVSEEHYRTELARIRVAMLAILENVPDDWPSAGLEEVRPAAALPTKSNTWWRSGTFWTYFIAAAGLLVALLAYLNDRGIFPPRDPAPLVQPAPEVQKPAEKSAETPPVAPVTTGNQPKNQTNVTVKDKAKVGTIITGDSNKIELKQDF